MDLYVKNEKAQLYHYSGFEIKDDFIAIDRPPNIHTLSAMREWGKSRAYFYGKKDGYKYDKGIDRTYLYICELDVDKIYNYAENPLNIEPEKNVHYKNSFYQKTAKLGYTAWYGYINPECPIVISFQNVKIKSKLIRTESGYRLLESVKKEDYIIGTIEIDNTTWNVYQRVNHLKRLNNCYLSKHDDSKEAMKSYKKPLEFFHWKDIDLYPEYKNIYSI